MSRHNSLLRWLRWIAIAFAGAFVALHIVNAIRMDAGELLKSSKALADRAADISERAMPEYQEFALARLPPNPNNGPFYRFDDNLAVARIVELPSDFKQEPGAEFQFSLEFGTGVEPGLIAAGGRAKVEQQDGLLVVSHQADDYLVTDQPISIPLAKISDIIVRIRADQGNRFQIGWTAEGRESELDRNQLSLDLIADGEFHTYVINAQNAFRRGVGIDENISLLSITPSNVDGAKVEIDFVRVVSKQWKYQVQQVGTSYETIEGELRPVLHLVPNQGLEYSVDVPEDNPELSFGAASLLGSPPVEASISITSGTDAVELYSDSTIDSDHWQDEIIDLSEWAGESVRIEFRVLGSGDNVAFFSNPMIRSAARRPFNVILILEDTLRADHLSTHGYRRETSPAKTRFMNERGVVFLNAHSQATKTRPSIPSMMTSLYPSATGVLNFSDSLSERYLTIAEILRAQGYVTASFIQNGNAGQYTGVHQGFSSLRDENEIGESTEDIFGEQILDWLDSNGDRNFFLYLHAIDPHGAYDPPAPYDRWYREAPADSMTVERPLPFHESIDPDWPDSPSAEARRLLYDGEIRHNDAVIEIFLQQLEARNLLDNTLLIFVSDHGEWLGEGGRWEHHPPGHRPVIHVPFMVSYPKLFDTPKRIEDSVQLVDAMPTILELASVDSSDLLMQGDSLVTLIQGSDADRWQKRVTVSEEPMLMDHENPCACGSLFFGPWQLHGSRIGWPGRIKSTFVKSAVYRFRNDELRPVKSYIPDLFARRLRQATISDLISANMETWRKLTEGQEQDVYKMDPATLEKLRGLGYVN